jgi:Acyl-protein synthetase, LuxE
MRDLDARPLRSILVDLFHHSIDEPIDDEIFNRAALRVFQYQFTRNSAYAAFCVRRERDPDHIDHWSAIPAVPTAAFKEVPLVTGSPETAEAIFRTSGTTAGPEKRGVHYVLDVSIYHFSLIPNFAACVLPDGAELRLLSLIPSGAELPDSSLSHMLSVLVDRLGAPDSGFFASASHGIGDERIAAALERAEADDAPVCLIGTSFAFVHWLDRLAARGDRYALPAGSRLMDTGGYKGRSREVDADEMRQRYYEMLGVPPSHCVNEYGMTEMCSQFYDSALRDAVRGRERIRHKLVPPWVRTRVVDPETLEPVAPGTVGLLQHFDLANLNSVMAIQTEDAGYAVDGGFHLIGRAPGATPRGCSIAMDLLLDAVSEQRRRP